MEEQQIKNKIDESIQSHTHDGNLSWRVNAEDLENRQNAVLYRIVKHDLDTSTGTTVGGDFVFPFRGNIIDVGATVDTAGTTGTTTVDINKNGTTILSTKITIDSTEKTSRTAATAYEFDGDELTRIEVGDILTFDIDAINSTAAKGLTVFVILERA